MNEVAIRNIIAPILELRLADFGYQDTAVRAGEDHDGDPVLFVEVSFDPDGCLLGGEHTIGITGEIRAALAVAGEHRFPHMRWNYLHGDAPIDDDADERLFAATASGVS